ITMGYPSPDAESGMLADHEAGDRVLSLRPVTTAADVLAAQDAAARIHAAEPLRDYVVQILWRTREDPRVDLGASPRGGLLLLGMLVPAWAWVSARAADVSRTLPRRRVIEGEPLEMVLRITGRRWVAGAEVIDPVAGSMTAHSGHPVTLSARFARRGRTTLDPPRLRVADPLGLVEVTRTGSGGAQEVLVLPQTDPVGWVDYRG